MILRKRPQVREKVAIPRTFRARSFNHVHTVRGPPFEDADSAPTRLTSLPSVRGKRPENFCSRDLGLFGRETFSLLRQDRRRVWIALLLGERLGSINPPICSRTRVIGSRVLCLQIGCLMQFPRFDFARYLFLHPHHRPGRASPRTCPGYSRIASDTPGDRDSQSSPTMTPTTNAHVSPLFYHSQKPH